MLLTLTRCAFVTFVVLVIFWALMQLLRRSLERTGGFGGHGRIRVVESRGCMATSLFIVRVDGRSAYRLVRDSISYLGNWGTVPASCRSRPVWSLNMRGRAEPCPARRRGLKKSPACGRTGLPQTRCMGCKRSRSNQKRPQADAREQTCWKAG